jgi:phosphoglycolate/pyridoxal phosphate phosphatase family enzyme
VAIADRYDAFLFDLDGVLFRGDTAIPGASDAVARLRELGRRLAFVTNNSSRTPSDVVAHLARVGIDAFEDEVVSSALTTAALLAERGCRRAFVVGEAGLRDALVAQGIEIRPDDELPVDVVVVGWDRTLTYETLRAATVLVQDGAALVASNADANYPAPDGHRWPGAGAILAAIETAAETRAEVIGKPHAPLLLEALARTGGARPLMIGDRLDTDIDGANRLGWDSCLVLTGISTTDDVERTGIVPTHVLDDLRGLLEPPSAP